MGGGWSEKWSIKWSEKWSEISGRKKEILELIRRNSKISREELSKSIGINPSAVQKHIDSLKQKGVLERVGAAKGGYWKIKVQ